MSGAEGICPECAGKLDHRPVQRSQWAYEWEPFCPSCGWPEPSRHDESGPAVSRQPSTDVPEPLGPETS